MRSSQSSSDCAILRARGLFHISITCPEMYSSTGSAAMRTPGQTKGLVFSAPVAATLPRLEVADQPPAA
jgi:hypothetical protein